MKVKSSVVLKAALGKLLSGEQSFVCAAIQDVETDLRYAHNDNITSKASQIFQAYKPASINESMKATQPWWAKGSEERIVALNAAIEVAIKKGD